MRRITLFDALIAVLFAAVFAAVAHAWREADWPRVFHRALRLTGR